MGNPDAGNELMDVVYDSYRKAWGSDGKDNPASDALWAERNRIEKIILVLTAKRAEERDNNALYLRAAIASVSGSAYFGYDSIYVLYECVVRGYEPCKQFDRFR